MLYLLIVVPEGAPRSVRAQALNGTSIAVTWLPPAAMLRNGRIWGYKIMYGTSYRGGVPKELLTIKIEGSHKRVKIVMIVQ